MLKRILTVLSMGLMTVTMAIIGEACANTSSQSTAATAASKKEVIIYSSKNCYWCTAVEKTFREKNIPFTVINVDNNPAKFKELQEKTGKETVPQVLIDGKHVGSYLDIVWGDVEALLQEETQKSE